MMDIREIDGLWCDDITFCPEQCEWESCPRNKENIRDRTIPHSFSIEIPQDCPKKQEVVKPFHKCIGNEHTLIEDSHFDFCPYCGKKLFWE